MNEKPLETETLENQVVLELEAEAVETEALENEKFAEKIENRNLGGLAEKIENRNLGESVENAKTPEYPLTFDEILLGILRTLGIEPTSPQAVTDGLLIQPAGLPVEVAERAGRLVAVALAVYGNRERAIAAIDRAFIIAAETDFSGPGAPLSSILSIRMAGILENVGVESIRDLCGLTVEELLAVPSLGAKSVNHIVSVLKSLGYELGCENLAE